MVNSFKFKSQPIESKTEKMRQKTQIYLLDNKEVRNGI